MPLERVTFALASDRALYTRFISRDGSCIAVDKVEDIVEARVAVCTPPGEWPTPEQYDTIEMMAYQAREMNPFVLMLFCPGTFPFEKPMDEPGLYKQIEAELGGVP